MGAVASDLSWVERELAGSTFSDRRLGKRLCKLVEQLSAHMGETIPLAWADWANTKAAYRFLSNDDVSDTEILAGHFASTAARIAATDGPILILQDTTEFVYKRSRPETIGGLTYAPNKKNRDRLLTLRTVCDLLMHSSLAVTPEGLPLGLTAVKLWSRSKFKGRNRLKHSINTTRIPIEQKESIRWLQSLEQTLTMVDDPKRCIHIGDREADIYELFCTVVELKTHFIIPTCVDRLAGGGDHTIATEMAEVEVKDEHVVEIHTLAGQIEEATLDLRYKRIRVLPPSGKEKRYPPLTLKVLARPEMQAAITDIFAPDPAWAMRLGGSGWRAQLMSAVAARALDHGWVRRRLLGANRLKVDRLLSDRDALEELTLQITGLGGHVAGTCKMGDPSDKATVVDPHCRVSGLGALRVVDASIMPTIVSANTNLTVQMIAERAADLILEDGER